MKFRLWLLHSTDFEAERDMPDIIRRDNAATGNANTDTSGYHELLLLLRHGWRAGILTHQRQTRR